MIYFVTSEADQQINQFGGVPSSFDWEVVWPAIGYDICLVHQSQHLWEITFHIGVEFYTIPSPLWIFNRKAFSSQPFTQHFPGTVFTEPTDILHTQVTPPSDAPKTWHHFWKRNHLIYIKFHLFCQKVLAQPPGPPPRRDGVKKCMLNLLVCGDPSFTGGGRLSKAGSW